MEHALFYLNIIDKLSKTLFAFSYSDASRCTFTSSAMGQANASRDKLYDLRKCDLSNQDASGFDLSGVIMKDTDVSKTKFVESQFSKAYLQGGCSFFFTLFLL